jgi:uncharacterized repeat protein (TIGR01451 family)/MYXO-CTERM domain-containing protein
MLLASGVALLLLSAVSAAAPTAYAIPPAALTPTAEPPTRTSTSQPATPIPVTATLPPRPTVSPTDTALPTNTPKPRPTDDSESEPAEPALTKSANVGEARIGDIIDFTLTVTNHGGETADDVVVTDALPDFLDVVDVAASTGAVTVDGRTVVIAIGQVAPKAVVIIHIRGRVNAQAQPPGGRNTATLTSSNHSDKPKNNVDSVDISILAAGAATASPTSAVVSPTAEVPTVAPTAIVAPPHLPNTGAAEGPASHSWLLALLGLAAIGLSLLLRRRASIKV